MRTGSPASTFTALIAGKFAAETNIGVVQRLLAQAQTAVTSYADEPWAAERGWPLLVDALLGLEPADSQPQIVRPPVVRGWPTVSRRVL